MKKLISLLLIAAMLLSLAACGGEKKPSETPENELNQTVTDNEEVNAEADVEIPVKDEEEKKEDKKEEDKKPSKNPQQSQTSQAKPNPPSQVTEQKPSELPEQKPAEQPAEKPVEKPAETPVENKTVGNILLEDFNKKANLGNSLTIAEELLKNPIIQFPPATMAVEPGYLTGFGNAEIKGFKEGAMFSPMIGTIPFVGYIFTLEDGQNTADFIKTLKASANLRWNVCTEAEEMVTGNVGNKVFFVMCKKSFDEE